MKDLHVTSLEQQILEAAARPEATLRRKRLVTISAFLAVAAIVSAALLRVSRTFFIVALIAHVLITLAEKVAYANAILGYKSLIRKLTASIAGPPDSTGATRPDPR